MRKPKAQRRSALVAVAAAMTLGVSACGDDPEDAAVPAEDRVAAETAEDDVAEDLDALEEPVAASPYDGPYDAQFYEDLTSYDLERVTVSADVDDVLGDRAFTITDTDATVDALLVIEGEEVDGIESGQDVEVSGTVHQELDVPAVEDDLGIDLDDAALDPWSGAPYIIADTTEAAA
jgi:hypothetical protein